MAPVVPVKATKQEVALKQKRDWRISWEDKKGSFMSWKIKWKLYISFIRQAGQKGWVKKQSTEAKNNKNLKCNAADAIKFLISLS